MAAEYLSRGINALFIQYPSLLYALGCLLLVSHLVFADDVIIFTNGAKPSLQKILMFLQEYDIVSGHQVNP